MPEKVRHQLFLDAGLSERFETLARAPGATKSAILADALDAWLNRRGTSELEDRFGIRLDRIGAALSRIERDADVLLETLALFVRYELAIHAPLAEDDRAGRALGRARFEAFVEQVGQKIAGGARTLGPRAGDGQ